jgi:hypothetical protein
MATEKKGSSTAAPNITPLLVEEAFGDFRRGDVIKDAELIQQILQSPQARFVTPLLENK